MAYPPERAVALISLTGWTSTMLICGPTAGIAALITAALCAAAAMLIRRRITTRRKPRRRFASGTRTTASGTRGTRFQAGADHGGKRRWMGAL